MVENKNGTIAFAAYFDTCFCMKSPFPGVIPPELDELDAVTLWPTIGANRLGRLVGCLCGSKIGYDEFFTLGKLWAVATIPLSLMVFFCQLLPYVCHRYTLTNRRIIIRRGWHPLDEKWTDLDGFDSIQTQVLPGQNWLHAGDLVFKRGEIEVLRLCGVSRPEVFRQVCLTAQTALLAVRNAAVQ
ncbi:MAG: PH domain-containing protein [Thermoguttaceae bacterium]